MIVVDWNEWRRLKDRVMSLGVSRKVLDQLDQVVPYEAVRLMREIVTMTPEDVRRLNAAA